MKEEKEVSAEGEEEERKEPFRVRDTTIGDSSKEEEEERVSSMCWMALEAAYALKEGIPLGEEVC